MLDVPSSCSDCSSSDEFGPDSFKGLGQASKYVGEGAILYLQNMKTFSVLFFILVILNLPLYMLFMMSTDDSSFSVLKYDFSNWESDSTMFRVTTFGNIGRLIHDCHSTVISHKHANLVFKNRINNKD